MSNYTITAVDFANCRNSSNTELLAVPDQYFLLFVFIFIKVGLASNDNKTRNYHGMQEQVRILVSFKQAHVRCLC